MVIVRNVFQIRPEEMKNALSIVREGRPLAQRLGMPAQRAMSDLVAGFYTLVLESEYPSLSAFEESISKAFSNPEWQAFYSRLRPLVAGGHREIFTLVE
jgi:hypothetical protein